MSNRRLSILLSLGSLASVCNGCVYGDVNAVVAPNLGKTIECVEPMSPDQTAKDWLARHPESAPQSWYDYEDYLADRVNPKLARDCE